MNYRRAVTNDLHFDMTRAFYESLNVDVTVAEGHFGFALTSFEHSGQIIALSRCSHASTTAACDGFNHDCAVFTKKRFGFFEGRRSLGCWH